MDKLRHLEYFHLMSKLFHMFPLSIYATKLEFSSEQRQKLTQMILDDAKSRETLVNKANKTWTGDVNGFEILHDRQEFAFLFKEVSNHLRLYLDKLGVDHKLFDLYFTRSWGTIAKKGQNVSSHTHMQSHLSMVYYPCLPKNSGDLVFSIKDNLSEFIPGLLSVENMEKGIVKGSDIFAPNMLFKAEEDLLLIFPSKIGHATEKSQSDDVRISISSDINCVVKDSSGIEFFLPPLKQWRTF